MFQLLRTHGACSPCLPCTAGGVEVAVAFDLHQHWWTDDPSMGPGRHDWTYLLVHRQGRWLIRDEGMG